MNVALDLSQYFANLFLLAIVFAPIYRFTKSVVIRQCLMVVMGALLLYYIAPRLVPLYMIYWIVVILAQRFMLHYRDSQWATWLLWVCLAVLIAPMILWKLFPSIFTPRLAWFGHSIISALVPDLGFVDSHHDLIIPVGLSFATFRALDLLLQTYLGTVGALTPGFIIAYGFCPMLIPVGPIATVQEVDFSLSASTTDVKVGLLRITLGLFKIFFLASMIQHWSGVFTSSDHPGWQLMIGLGVFAFYFYLNFAGFSDLAIGSSRLFGMKMPENFRWPLFRGSPQKFWANWHASLSRFAQRYIFIAVGGYRRNRQSIALLATMMVIAWWHDLNLSWTIFGIYHGCGLIVHRLYTTHKPKAIIHIQGRWYYQTACVMALFSFVALGFPIISLPPEKLLDFYMALLK